MEKVYQVCKEMFAARNYKITEQGQDEEIGWYLKGIAPDKHKIYLYILINSKLNVELIKYYYRMLHEMNIKHAILVYQNVVTSSVNKLVQSIDIKFELFSVKELSFNLLKHELVPEHVKIGMKKKNDLQYPILKKSDPVSKFMGFKHGDIIQINRRDGSIYYRFVK